MICIARLSPSEMDFSVGLYFESLGILQIDNMESLVNIAFLFYSSCYKVLRVRVFIPRPSSRRYGDHPLQISVRGAAKPPSIVERALGDKMRCIRMFQGPLDLFDIDISVSCRWTISDCFSKAAAYIAQRIMQAFDKDSPAS
jgi:hypothetical protein